MVSLTVFVWATIALWVFVAVFAYAAIRVAHSFDNPAPPKVRKPRVAKASRRDDEV